MQKSLLTLYTFVHVLFIHTDLQEEYVADAASQYLHIFVSEDGNWNISIKPDSSIKLLDEQTFLAGRYNPYEGGIKGIDIANQGQLMVVSNEHRQLAIYDLDALDRISDQMEREEYLDKVEQRNIESQITLFETLMGKVMRIITYLKYSAN